MTPASTQLARLLSELAQLPQLISQSALEVNALRDLLHSPKGLENLPLLVTDEMMDAFNGCTPPETLSGREVNRMKIAAALSVAKMAPNQVLPEEWRIRVVAKEDAFIFQIISPSADDLEQIPAVSREIPGVITLGLPRDGSPPSCIMAGLYDALQLQGQ